MIEDRPSNPRIRTKISQIDNGLDETLYQHIDKLRLGGYSVDEFQNALAEFCRAQASDPNFSALGDKTSVENQSHWLIKRHIDYCRYSALFYHVAENEAHPPHHHHNVISTQIVISGTLQLREYERIERRDDGRLVLKLVSDRMIGPGDIFQASEWSKNVHWFCAEGGPAVIFNINARGFEDKTFDTDEAAFGRCYIDPTQFDNTGLIITEEFDAERAHELFQGRRLDEFPIPA
ncbi:MAG: hypothetical protein COB78_08665 [Hyphomicrobiales bacterium]|nr:MAG: hypothetical protein COB78_08665 [Hyphomicrobiales bacterium]